MRIVLIAGCLGLAAAAQALAQPAAVSVRMKREEGVQLMEAAGFRPSSGQTLNRCGQAAQPTFVFADLNGDGAPEAIVTDRNVACYGGKGDRFSILVRTGAGEWRPLVSDAGALQWQATRSEGWFDLKVTTDCARIWRHNGRLYLPGRNCL